MRVNPFESEYEGCSDCVFWCVAEDSEPCNVCKHNIPYYDPRYENAPSIYIPNDTTMNEIDIEDIINHPNHYTNGGMECIDEMILIFGKRVVADFCLCNAWKYRYRALHKNGQEDIDKSHWYISKYNELIEESRCEDDYIPF